MFDNVSTYCDEQILPQHTVLFTLSSPDSIIEKSSLQNINPGQSLPPPDANDVEAMVYTPLIAKLKAKYEAIEKVQQYRKECLQN